MKTILIVEDDAIVRKNLAVFLAGEGYRVQEAGDGLEAMNALKEGPLDLVLSDIVMPRMDGLALIQQIRSTWPRTRVIAMTAYFHTDSETRFSVAGADGFIRKPITLDHLLSMIQRLLPKESSPH